MRWGMVLIAGLTVLVGCFQPPPATMDQRQQGLVYMFPGIGCGAWCLEPAYRALRDAGVEAEIRIHEWGTPFYDAMGHLMDYEQNQKRAQIAADQLVAYRSKHPKATIDLVGYSGGGGLTVLVMETLPEDIQLHNVVLVQSAVTPTYDLTQALKRVDGKLVNLYAPGDVIILGWGTLTFGNIDRAHAPAAGKEGFDIEQAVPDKELRSKIVQQGWSPSVFFETGHAGMHAGILGYAWNRAYVAPWLVPGDVVPARE